MGEEDQAMVRLTFVYEKHLPSLVVAPAPGFPAVCSIWIKNIHFPYFPDHSTVWRSPDYLLMIKEVVLKLLLIIGNGVI